MAEPRDVMRKTVRDLLALMVKKHGSIDCPAAVEDIVDFCRSIYTNARRDEAVANDG